MKSNPTLKPEEKELHAAKAVEHVSSARRLLTALHAKANWEKHPELQQAITEIEMALNILTIKTSAML